MMTFRKTAITVGVLYILGTVTGVLSLLLTKPLLDASASLLTIAEQGNQIRLGALLVLMMGIALAMVPVMMYPILKKHNEVLALGYVVFRGGLETCTYIAGAIFLLLLASFSQVAVQSEAAGAVNVQAMGTVFQQAVEICTTMTEIVFPLGALMFYAVLYQANLLPRWIAGWGLVAALLYEAGGILHLFALTGQTSTIMLMLVLPMAVQEMVMAVWLIVKGFNASAFTSSSAKTETNELVSAA
jgi:hypothetical protein